MVRRIQPAGSVQPPVVNPKPSISRREFLSFCGLNITALALPRSLATLGGRPHARAFFASSGLPEFVRLVLAAVPDLEIDAAGRLWITGPGGEAQLAALAPTQWNLEHRRAIDRLEAGRRWGIVLHWFGDDYGADMPLDAYLRGFDSMRPVFNYMTRTSAHFLVGNAAPGQDGIGIVQTQEADADGTPFLSSHLQALDYSAHLEMAQYFVRAFYQLAQNEPGVDSLLQEMFDSPVVVDPNLRTIAIDLTGLNFDDPASEPSTQKYANAAAIVWALMKRYRISITDVLGHHEIQLGKSDPGKQFIGILRFLIGFIALADPNPLDRHLVFGAFRNPGAIEDEAVRRFFRFLRDYMVLVAAPRDVYEWEAKTRYWLAVDFLSGHTTVITGSCAFYPPLLDATHYGSQQFLDPHDHEGLDLVCKEEHASVHLISSGICLYHGSTEHPHWEKIALFRHRQPDGAEVIAVYGHLDELSDLVPGGEYPCQFPIGSINRQRVHQENYLHFAVAYGASWDTDLARRPQPPPNASVSWISSRYLNPAEYINRLLTNEVKSSLKGFEYD